VIADYWRSLENLEAPDASGYVKRRLRPDLPLDLFMAVARPSGRRSILVTIGADVADQIPHFGGSRGIQSQMLVAGGGRTLEISLRDMAYADIFDRLLDDVIISIPMNAGGKAAAFVVARLGRWQKFLTVSPLPLGEESQRGLFGELWFLKTRAMPVRGIASVANWLGPTLAAQDFQFVDLAVEVKTSVADQDQSLHIVSERQLDDLGIARLFLFHVSVDGRAGERGSLPDLVDSIRADLRGGPWAETFEEHLSESGYADVDRDRYLQPCYTIREENLFRVTGNFPRLTERDLPAGVSDIHYVIRLSACRPFAVGFDELRP